GTPDEVVYDQDKVFVSDENKGDIILTDKFRAYTREMDFSLHFCRKADPQSKGKVENVVKYVKQNFLYNRIYYNIETLNDDALGWLGRTANALPHSFTKKVPFTEWNLELPFLKPYKAHIQKVSAVSYSVRKDNTISYKSNLYSLPLGTYKGRGCTVAVYIEQGYLTIFAPDGIEELCKHQITSGQGIKIINTDHKRDKALVINEMIENISALLEDPELGKQWMATIRIAKPRYIRDQLLLTKQVIEKTTNPAIVTKAICYCIENKITSANDLKAIVTKYGQEEQEKDTVKIIQLNPLGGTLPIGATTKPDQSQIDDYKAILENKQKL
ncbi:MAG TPA: IS21 family transposase, partial [Bacteroidia bacterium]|nr:IS21 family transposase [Bacteroidia bacterium]